MKKLMLILAMFGFIAFGQLGAVMAQEAQEDSLSIDDMAPVFYEAEESSSADSGSSSTLIIVVVAVVVVGGAAYFFTKKKK